MPLPVAMQILGHSQITLTLGTYRHVVPELAADAAEQISPAPWAPVARDDAVDAVGVNLRDPGDVR